METISDYTIYCTPDQVRKALKLGAPIYPTSFDDCGIHQLWDEEKHCYYDIPTTEQMIGWLKAQGMFPCVEPERYKGDISWIAKVYDINSPSNYHSYEVLYWKNYPSHEGAIHAAIDAALDYLTNKK